MNHRGKTWSSNSSGPVGYCHGFVFTLKRGRLWRKGQSRGVSELIYILTVNNVTTVL